MIIRTKILCPLNPNNVDQESEIAQLSGDIITESDCDGIVHSYFPAETYIDFSLVTDVIKYYHDGYVELSYCGRSIQIEMDLDKAVRLLKLCRG